MKRFSAFLGVALMALTLLINTAPVLAATTSSSGLSINPRKNYVMEPGKEATDKLIVTNLDHERDLDLTLKLIDFTFTDDSGTPKLLLAENAAQTTWSLKPFINLPKDPITIKAGQSKTIDFKIKIPKNQGAGSYYGAIEYISGPGNGGNLALNASGVTLAFLSVPGVVREDMSLKKLGAFLPDKEGVGGKYIFIATGEMPKQIAYSIENKGNVFESPVSSITMKGMFGKTYTIKDANAGNALALIGQTRRFQACIVAKEKKVDFEGKSVPTLDCENPNLWPGRYSIKLDSFYGQNGNQTHEIVGSASFWYLPLWFIIAVAVVLLIVGFFIWKVVRKLQGKSGKDKRRLSFRKR